MQEIPNDLKSIIEAAIANEIEGHKILQRSEESASNPLAQAAFDFLANEELKHIDLIREFSNALDADTAWDPERMREIALDKNGAAIRGIFERFATQFEEVATADDERLEIYKIAMDMERRGYEFYSRAASKATDERARALFEFLAAEETKHFQIIQDTHDFIQQPDAILATEERWMQT